MKNKKYLILYLTSIGISIISLIQTGLALSIESSTVRFIEGNPIGYNWFLFLLVFFAYLLLSIPFFIKSDKYTRTFSIVLFYMIVMDLICIIHDYIVINIISKLWKKEVF